MDVTDNISLLKDNFLRTSILLKNMRKPRVQLCQFADKTWKTETKTSRHIGLLERQSGLKAELDYMNVWLS